MNWIIASIPLWIVGGLMLILGVYGLVKVSFNESDDVRTFKEAPDGDVTMITLCMILLSSAPLALAAWLVT